MSGPDLEAVLEAAAPLIDATVAMTGRPRHEYEDYLTAPPAPGVAWSSALKVRLDSLAAGPLPAGIAREVSRMVSAEASGSASQAA